MTIKEMEAKLASIAKEHPGEDLSKVDEYYKLRKKINAAKRVLLKSIDNRQYKPEEDKEDDGSKYIRDKIKSTKGREKFAWKRKLIKFNEEHNIDPSSNVKKDKVPTKKIKIVTQPIKTPKPKPKKVKVTKESDGVSPVKKTAGTKPKMKQVGLDKASQEKYIKSLKMDTPEKIQQRIDSKAISKSVGARLKKEMSQGSGKSNGSSKSSDSFTDYSIEHDDAGAPIYPALIAKRDGESYSHYAKRKLQRLRRIGVFQKEHEAYYSPANDSKRRILMGQEIDGIDIDSDKPTKGSFGKKLDDGKKTGDSKKTTEVKPVTVKDKQKPKVNNDEAYIKSLKLNTPEKIDSAVKNKTISKAWGDKLHKRAIDDEANTNVVNDATAVAMGKKKKIRIKKDSNSNSTLGLKANITKEIKDAVTEVENKPPKKDAVVPKPNRTSMETEEKDNATKKTNQDNNKSIIDKEGDFEPGYINRNKA